MKYKKHIFICTNDRGDGHPRKSCGNCGGLDIRKEFVRLINESDLKGKVRANKSGCLASCLSGPTVVIYPDQIWYKNVKINDVTEIIHETIINNCARI